MRRAAKKVNLRFGIDSVRQPNLVRVEVDGVWFTIDRAIYDALNTEWRTK